MSEKRVGEIYNLLHFRDIYKALYERLNANTLGWFDSQICVIDLVLQGIKRAIQHRDMHSLTFSREIYKLYNEKGWQFNGDTIEFENTHF